jgi:hypothetical protein
MVIKIKLKYAYLTTESIIYAMICTHPDVSCKLNVTTRYQSGLDESQLRTVKNILKYLRRIKMCSLSIVIRKVLL